MTKLSYEKPSFKKYGTMKELTLAGCGSGGDLIIGSPNIGPEDDPNTIPIDDNFFGDFNPIDEENPNDPETRPAGPFENPCNPLMGDI